MPVRVSTLTNGDSLIKTKVWSILEADKATQILQTFTATVKQTHTLFIVLLPGPGVYNVMNVHVAFINLVYEHKAS